MAKKLNMNRADIGKVFPPHKNRHFEVDNQFYDAEGYPVDANTGERMAVEKETSALFRPETKVKKGSFVELDDNPDAILDAPINLKAWAKGDETHPWHAVQAQFQREYAVVPANKIEAYDILKVNKKVGLAGAPQVKSSVVEAKPAPVATPPVQKPAITGLTGPTLVKKGATEDKGSA